MSSIGRLAFESIVQRETLEANRARMFVKFETRNQLVWVCSGLVDVVAVGLVFLAGPAGGEGAPLL